jgi:hypothetical protein
MCLELDLLSKDVMCSYRNPNAEYLQADVGECGWAALRRQTCIGVPVVVIRARVRHRAAFSTSLVAHVIASSGVVHSFVDSLVSRSMHDKRESTCFVIPMQFHFCDKNFFCVDCGLL